MSRRRITTRLLLVELLLFIAGIALAVDITVNVTAARTGLKESHARWLADSTAIAGILSQPRYDMRYAHRLDTMPSGGISLRVDRSRNHHREFNDSNYLHLAAARAIGIQPIEEIGGLLADERYTLRLNSSPEYFIDTLRHSLPYLVPDAATLLHDIGKAFNDSLAARGGGDYRIKVTSMLRTGSTIRRLRRGNRNAVSTSAHLYGTTFDISYSNFACDSRELPRTTDDLKALLAEILSDFRDKGRCYVKHERRQSCFHITARPSTLNQE